MTRTRRLWHVTIEDSNGRKVMGGYDHVPKVCDLQDMLEVAKQWDLVDVLHVRIDERLTARED